MADFESREKWNAERIHALAIYCSDGRWGEAFDDLCHRGLKIPRYDRFAVPGGPLWLSRRHISLLWSFDAARLHLSFLVEAHALKRIVLITHHGCAYYGNLLGADADACMGAQEHDLGVAASILGGWFPLLRIEGYIGTQVGEGFAFRAAPLTAASGRGT